MTLRERAKELNNRLFHTSSHKDEEREELIVAAFWQVVREENEACKHEVDVFKDSLGLHLHSRITSRIRSRLEAK